MFRFAHPYILNLLIIIPLLIIFFSVMMVRKRKAIAHFGNPELLSSLMPLMSIKREIFKFCIVLLALFFIIIGAAGPQFGSKLQQIKRKGVELMIALDVSNSMMAEDIKPNRLERAKLAISRMVEKLTDDKIGLIIFAGDAYVQLPITTDYSSAKLFLSNITPDMVPLQGTAIGKAIDMSVKSFTPETETSKAIIVITDGENHQDDAVEAAKSALASGIHVHTIGMGLETGAPIPVKGSSGEFMKDIDGNVVMSKLDENMLKDVAKAGEGLYVRASNAGVGLEQLLSEVNKMQKSLLEEKVYSDYAEKYQYFILIGVILLILNFLILERKNKYIKNLNIFARK